MTMELAARWVTAKRRSYPISLPKVPNFPGILALVAADCADDHEPSG